MSWTEELGRVSFDGKSYIGGSFRGVPFFVEDSSQSGGRRLAIEDFPYSSEGFEDDLGRKRRRIHISAYLIGDTYLQQKQRLIDALEAEGPGECRLPYTSTLTLRCENFDVKESRKDGGIATFSIEFVDALSGELSFQAVASVASQAKVAKAAAGTVLVKQATQNPIPRDFLDGPEAALKAASTTIRAAFSPLTSGPAEARKLRARLDTMATNAFSLVTVPIDAANAIAGVFDSSLFAIPRLPAQIYQLIAAIEKLIGPPSDVPLAETDTYRKQQIYVRAIQENCAINCALTAAELTEGLPFESYEDAQNVRDALGAALDARGNDEGWETVRGPIEAARGSLLAKVPGNQRLRLMFAPQETTAAIVLAFRFYGSADLALEMTTRNHAKNPCFLPGGVPVEVLRG